MGLCRGKSERGFAPKSLAQPEKLLLPRDWICEGVLAVNNKGCGKIGGPVRVCSSIHCCLVLNLGQKLHDWLDTNRYVVSDDTSLINQVSHRSGKHSVETGDFPLL